MSINVLFRGRKALPLEEVRDRFSQYYPQEVERAMGFEPKKNIFHKSDSFIGYEKDGEISFTDQFGQFKNDRGINKQIMADLRKLGDEAESYMKDNPALYINTPTSDSRARLYRRSGFKDDPSPFFGVRGIQALDTRRIASDDIPYVASIDRAIYGDEVSRALGYNSLPPFIKSGINVISASSLKKVRNPFTGGRLAHPLFDGDEEFIRKQAQNVLESKKFRDNDWM